MLRACWLQGVGQAQRERASPCVGQPIVVHVLEGVCLPIQRIEQVSCPETDGEVVANALRQVEIKGRGGPLINVRSTAFSHEEELVALDVEGHGSVEFGAVSLVCLLYTSPSPRD